MSSLRITREDVRRAAEKYKLVGVHCVSCKTTIEGSLSKLPGVRRVEVDPNSGLMVVEFEEGADRARVLAELRKLGYDAVTGRLTLKLRGLRAGAESAVESKLSRIPGVVEVRVYGSEGLVSLTYNPAETSAEALIEKVKEAGFDVEKVEEASGARGESYRGKLLVAAAGTLIYLAGRFLLESLAVEALGALVTYSVALKEFVAPALAAARRGYATMDTLLALGTTAALLLSLYSMARGGHVYFDAVVFITLFVVAGRAVEGRLREKASRILEEASKLVPEKARVKRGGRIVEVPSSEVRAGEIVVVRVGERVPVDGRVASGEGLVDEAPLTGESVPRRVEPGSLVLAGSTLVQGYLEVTALRTGEYTLAMRALEAAREAALAKPRLQRLADRIAGVFVYAVMAVAGVTFGYWYLIAGAPLSLAVIRSVTVLVVACPCALGIAIPAALAAGVSRAYRLGVMVRNPDSLDALAKVTVVAMDKTGTITKGRPRVVAVRAFNGFSEAEVLRLAAAVEAASSHPLARAIVEAAGRVEARVSGFTEIPGKGVLATVDGRSVAVGNWKLMQAMGVDGAEPELPEGVQTPVYVAVDGRLAGLIGISDEPRPEAREALEAIGRLGARYLVLTGDSERGARVLAARLGIPPERIRWGLDPIEKKMVIEDLRGRGERVAYVGDGVNDAPALAAANVGIAVNTALDIAKQSGDAVLARDDLRIIPAFIELSRNVYRKVRLNLLWAFAYNTVLIPVAAGAFVWAGIEITPAMAAAAMSLSSVTVTANSATILAWKPKVAGIKAASS